MAIPAAGTRAGIHSASTAAFTCGRFHTAPPQPPFHAHRGAGGISSPAMELHPDHGGDKVLFRLLVAERDRAMTMAR